MTHRVAAGVPTGGQYAASARKEAAPGTLGAVTGSVDDETLAEALAFAVDYCEAAGGARPGMCQTAAWNIREDFGWPIVAGHRDGLPHHWNQMPDGRVFDATAAMFGDGGPTVAAHDDPRYTVQA